MKNVAWTGMRPGRCIRYASQKILHSIRLVPLPPEAEDVVGCDSTPSQEERW
jgi:hypothetical protein